MSLLGGCGGCCRLWMAGIVSGGGLDVTCYIGAMWWRSGRGLSLGDVSRLWEVGLAWLLLKKTCHNDVTLASPSTCM